MENVQFIKCTLKDLKILRAISETTFVQAFGEQNDKADMEAYIGTAFSTPKIRSELLNKDSIFYFVALEDNTRIGYFKLNQATAQSEPIENGLEIERIYLLDKYQGKGIGQLMMDKAFEVAKKLKKAKLWLGVWAENKGAIRFYSRNGFRKFTEHDFYLGKDLQTDWLMEIDL